MRIVIFSINVYPISIVVPILFMANYSLINLKVVMLVDPMMGVIVTNLFVSIFLTENLVVELKITVVSFDPSSVGISMLVMGYLF